MPLSHYGVLKGIPTHYRNSWTANNHYQVRINAAGEFFRIAVNVRSKLTPHDLLYRVIDRFDHPVLDLIKDLPEGFSDLESKPNKGSLDYIRGNLLDIENMQVIPETQSGKNNDLNDLFDFYVHQAISEQAFVYAFGERWFPQKPKDKYFPDTPDQGIHDIHMNQGNDDPGQFARDNGVWQDGGIFFHFPASDKWVALFLRFQSQAIHTDDVTGAPIAGPPPPPPPPAEEPQPSEGAPYIRILAALVNPKGQEEGNEKVLLFNASSVPVPLDNWAIANNMKKKHTLLGAIQSGETRIVTLPQGVPLSNKGGIITLLDANGLKVHGVSYTKAEAQREGFWITF